MKFIVESVVINNKLNPKLFNTNNSLKEEIREQLIKIAEKFIEDIKEASIPIRVIDYWFLGSNASYNYTDKSDIDVHIIADISASSSDPSVLKLLYDYFKSNFNDKYNIKVKGHEVELYIEDINSLTVSNGIYSLTKDEWIKVPKKIKVNNIEIESTALYQLMLKRFNTDENIQQLIDDLYILRKTSLANEGEFGIGNLVFKAFRNNGYLQSLKDKVTAEETKQLSLEKLEETVICEWGPRGQGKVCRTLIQLLKLFEVNIDTSLDWVLHHKAEHEDESLDNLVIMTRGDHVRHHVAKRCNKTPVYHNDVYDIGEIFRKIFAKFNSELSAYEDVAFFDDGEE